MRKYMISVLLLCMSTIALVGCSNNQTTSKPSTIYNSVNKEDSAFKEKDDGNDYISSSNTTLDVVTDKDNIKVTKTPEPIEIQTTIELTPTPTMQVVENEYTCIIIKDENEKSYYVPLVGVFEEATKTDNFTPVATVNEIDLFWGSSDTTVLRTGVYVESETHNEEFFKKYLSNIYDNLDPSVVSNASLSDTTVTTTYDGYVLYSNTLTYDLTLNENTTHILMQTCYTLKDGAYVFSYLQSREDTPPVDMSALIDVMYPIILDYQPTETTETTE